MDQAVVKYMKKYVVVLNIDCEENDFAQCYNYICNIEQKNYASDIDLKINELNKISFYELKYPYLTIIKMVEDINDPNKESIELNLDYKYCVSNPGSEPELFYLFNIKCETKNINNLRYIPLIYEGLKAIRHEKDNKKKLVFNIILEKDNDYFRASHFLFCENISSKIENKGIYFVTCFSLLNKIIRPQLNGIGALEKIPPLIKITRKSYGFFTSSLKGKSHFFKEIFNLNLNNNGLYNRIVKIMEKFGTLSSDEAVLIDTCYNYLNNSIFSDEIFSSDVQGKIMSLDDLLEKCNGLSFLAFFLFASFSKFVFSEKKASSGKKKDKKMQVNMKDINNLLQESQDYADSILQLMDNATEYSMVSYFSFRIYETERAQFLKENYPHYNIEKPYYLEIALTDFNPKNGITENFKLNLDSKYNIDNETKIKFKEKIELIDFFDPSNETQVLWDTMYKIGNNAAFHYGLQIFDTIVKFGNGFFSVCSSSNVIVNAKDVYMGNYDKIESSCSLSYDYHFPGTNYLILLPLKSEIKPRNGEINATLNYSSFRKIKNIEIIKIDFRKLLNEFDENNLCQTNSYNRELKEKRIEELAKTFKRKYDEFNSKSSYAFLVNVEAIEELQLIESFSKILIIFLLNIYEEKKLKAIGIINCSPEFIIAFTRSFAIFYNKRGKCPAMKNHQLYLGSAGLENEFLFFGEDINSTLQSSAYFEMVKGKFSICQEIVSEIAQKRKSKEPKNAVKFEMFPFDVLINDGIYTLFEDKVKKDLNRDMQGEAFGCCLKSAHTRIGSKIHITDRFIEASLIFSSSYYVTRFAYLIAKKIVDKKIKQDIVLIGYEPYSEILINEVQKALSVIWRKETRCVIYEQNNDLKFRNWEDSFNQSVFIIIVPINSTLTTFNKIIADIKRQIKPDNIKELNSRIHNIAVIVIKDLSEKRSSQKNSLTNLEFEYWKDISKPIDRKIFARTFSPNEVSYFILIESNWEEPYVCNSCFPRTNYIDEKAILEVNKASIVPMIMVGLNSTSNMNNEILPGTNGNIKYLKDFLIYKHFQRQGNHFQYYFKTDELFEKVKTESAFRVWINDCKDSIINQKRKSLEKNKEHVFDIIVTPIHFSNAAFVGEVNDKIFLNASIVINLDGEREYRDNIKTKYSNISSLYKNIILSDREAIINFHYVDDTIVSGKTFYRAKSLIYSLFPEKAFSYESKVKVNIFQNVIVLINRCFPSTIINYVNNADNFLSFINLSIPSIRNHQDSCLMCQLVEDLQKLYKLSSTNEFAEYWFNQIKKYSVSSELILEQTKVNTILKERAYRRMECTHNVYNKLSEINEMKNDSNEVSKVLYSLILEKLQDENLENEIKIEYLISYIKVTSRPFLSFRKSILDAVFKFDIILLDYLIGDIDERNDARKNYKELVDLWSILDFISDESNFTNKMNKVFLEVLISSLAGLNSKFIIRLKNINRIMNFNKKIGHDNYFDKTKFTSWYATKIKKLICLSNDESLCIWLEHGLINGYEYKRPEETKEYSIDKYLRDLLYLENTSILCEGIIELAEKESSIKDEIKEYYLEKFRRFILMNFNGSMKDDPEKFSLEKDEVAKEVDMNQNDDYEVAMNNEIMNTIDYYKHLVSKENNTLTSLNQYYDKLLEIIVLLTSSCNASILGEQVLNNNENLDNDKKYYIISEKRNEENEEKAEIIEEINKRSFKYKELEVELKNSSKIGDTLYINECFDNTTKERYINKVIIKLENLYESDSDNYKKNIKNEKCFLMDSIFIRLEFKPQSKRQSVLRKIRIVIAFRFYFIKRLKYDFNNNLFMKNQSLEKSVTALSNDKTANHSSYDFLIESCKFALVYKEKPESIDLAVRVLQLGANSLISKIYTRSILGELKSKSKSPLAKKLDKLPSEYLDKISYAKEGTLINAKVIYKDNFWEKKIVIEQGRKEYVYYFIVAIVENALKHTSLKNKEELVDIEIYSSENYLVIKNIKDSDEQIKSNNGITLYALSAYFKEVFDKELRIDSEGGFKVSLPIFYLD